MTNIWKDWFEKQTDQTAADLPKRIQHMRIVHGRRDDKTCGDCRHFHVLGGYARNYYKCELFRLSHGTATDWRVRWPACGKWE
ncbi:MAG: hypothetical protein CVU46_09560 [Chloroflexi bacterium HGW-Chloroflexi-8]|nr:MAG: hypothetical protein CVU46_09560 [Chloroflexi bacterium HGW-Chloroflexi-8]